MIKRTLALQFAFLLFLAGSRQMNAGDSTPTHPLTSLPAFNVQDQSGKSVSSADLERKGKWLLLYLTPDCPGCDSILRLPSPETPGSQTKLVVIVGKIESSQLNQFATKYPNWQQAGWYSDSNRETFQKLQLMRLPILFGMRDDHVAWQLDTRDAQQSATKSAVMTWLRP
jgi:hypothetical protein